MPIGNQTIIIGIDPGIADTGYGIISESRGQLTMITYGSIKTHKSHPLPERLKQLSQQLQKIISQYNPTVAVVEELFFCNNAKTALVVGQARGVALLNLINANIEIMELTPLQVKQGLTGYGKAEKGQIQQMVKMILCLKEIPRPDDASDALAMAICGANMYKLHNSSKR
jgi:crossover junction endodeoxyribonuclease RuvC